MKKLHYIIGAFLVLFTIQSNAQVSVNLNIGGRPDWCDHYHEDRLQYVYLPELECYYDNFAQVYIYYGPRGWVRSSYLPDYCHGYDIHRGPRVVIDYRGASPWVNFGYHRKHYWRNNYRNYHREYYGPNYNRRGNHVAVVDRHDYRDYRDNGNYYRRGDDDDRREYRRSNDDDRREYRRNDNNDYGNGRGHGRR